MRLSVNIPQYSDFEKRVMDISTPGHELYGKHMSRSEVDSYLTAAPEVAARIVRWLNRFGIPSEQIRNAGNMFTFTASVEQAEAMLNTQYYYWFRDGKQLIRTLQYSVDSDVRDFINMIQPTTYFNQPQAHIVKPTSLKTNFAWPNSTRYDNSDCNDVITPECLRKLYQLGNYTNPLDKRNILGISGFLEEYAQYDDWLQFASIHDPNSLATNRTFSVESIEGGLNLQYAFNDSSEANLDIQYTMSLTGDTPVTYFTTAGRGPLVLDSDQKLIGNVTTNEPYLEELHYLLSLPDERLPKVLSTSYGENEQSVPRSFAENVCFLIAQLGARGVSVIFSSGDSGVGSSCISNDGSNSTRFLPVFPASCPFVTSVGGTEGINPERGVYFSSGGFSDIWPRPQYQSEAVQCYLDKLGSRFSGLYNKFGRGFPDVSAQASNFLIVDKGAETLVHGTSASAPVFAAIISNLNAARLSLGQAPLGFLNPLLYGAGRIGFTDIVEGGNIGCTGRFTRGGGRGRYVPGAGFNATQGWDPVTGLGTPIWPNLLGISLAGFHGT
jgi:tripeptidyl-peptidase I